MENQQTETKNQEPVFKILKTFTRSMSFETPTTLQLTEEDKHSEVNVDLNVTTDEREKDTYEVDLNVTVTSKVKDKTLFLIELTQVGFFLIKYAPNMNIQAVLNTLCPSLLFPEAREAISNLITRGGFPPFYLEPVDFNAAYQKQIAEQQKEEK